MGRGPRLLHTAFTQSFIAPVSRSGGAVSDGVSFCDEHPANTVTTTMTIKDKALLIYPTVYP
ncbi:Mycobacterium rhizamassiliense ORFan [Mycobacterium rhizamassiliense]|uniref:Mycobacterium rhizamassiliense ORFan n=1 Tax=Mycobacterium rhizamassiliense TaxID=1841860 RepID=A0A2U3NWA9_9MYCO|nr:Mycobacterium rhizamassiliense ORFan [Mycobacterium rhizamassiliense]